MTPLTIAHIDTQSTWRGGERQVLELIKGLESRDQRNILVCRPSSALSERAGETGIPIVHLTLLGEWDLLSVLKIRSLIKKENIDIIHAHTSHAHTLGMLATIGQKTCKLVVSRRVDFHIRNFFGRKVKYGASVDKIIAISDAIRRILIEDGVDPERIVAIRSGFVPNDFQKDDIPHIDIRGKYGIPESSVVISTVAALAPHKAHYVLLKAARRVVDKHPDTKFLFAGEGDLAEDIKKNIYNLQLEKSVILLGFIEDIASVFRASDIFALSSREEGLCTSLYDAMYFGLPIVATSAGGIPEIVQDGINGLIVPVGDFTQFAEKINYLIENIDRRKKMGARSTDILKHNTIDKTIDRTLELYRTLHG